MDRIRNAISRARTEKDAGEPEAPQPVPPRPQPAPRREPRAIGGVDAIPTVVCDTEEFARHRIISNEQDPVLNVYRVLRTRVMQKIEQNGWRTIAVVSPGASTGKTVTAINLAIALGAKAGMRPTLVDLDFYRPSVARYLGVQEAPSVLDYYEGKRSLPEVTVRPDIADIMLVPNERVTRRGAELLTTDRTEGLIETALRDYRSTAVIFDMSPLLGCDDTIAFLPKVDCVLLIAASNQTRVGELKEAKRILGATNIIGTVLNKSPSVLMPNAYY